MSTTSTKNLSTEEKVSILFDYVFSGEKAKEEDFFWNHLSEGEMKDLEKIKEEKTISFVNFKKKSGC